jgi:uncharacterized membrane protein
MIIYKTDFINELTAQLAPLPAEEKKSRSTTGRSLSTTGWRDGMSEERAVAGLGDVGDIARQIILETPMASLVKTKVRERKMNAFWIICLCSLSAVVPAPDKRRGSHTIGIHRLWSVSVGCGRR